MPLQEMQAEGDAHSSEEDRQRHADHDGRKPEIDRRFVGFGHRGFQSQRLTRLQ
jgi:hypothetical protein